MVRMVFSLLILFVIGSSYADNFKGKTVVVASFLGDGLNIVTFKATAVSSIEEVFILDLKVDNYVEKKLTTELEKRLAVTAKVIANHSIIPNKMEFGIIGPADDEKVALIKRSDINADFLLLLYPGESSTPYSVKGGGIVSTGAGMDHVFFRIELLLFDLNKDAFITHNNIHEIETYSFKREPLKEERDELAKYALDESIKGSHRKNLQDHIYSKPFDGEKLLELYEEYASNEFEEAELEEVVSDFGYMIDARTTTVTSELNRYQPHELNKLKEIIYTALDEAVPQLVDIIQGDEEEDF